MEPSGRARRGRVVYTCPECGYEMETLEEPEGDEDEGDEDQDEDEDKTDEEDENDAG